MDTIKQALTGGDPRSLGRTEEVVGWVLTDQTRLPELFDCLFDDDEIIRMRAGDTLEKVCRQNPDWLKPYTGRLLDEVSAIEQPSVQWHLAQMLGEIALSAGHKVKAIALLKGYLETDHDWIVTNCSLETLAKFAREDASLRPDFLLILKKHQNNRRKSVVSRVRKLLKEFG